MATGPSSGPGAGGKIVTSRRRHRLAVTPYVRPSPPPPSRIPNWLTRVLIPSARALASGAGKILSSAIFSDSESSSSEDLNSASEDDLDDVNEHESAYDLINSLNELTSSAIVQHGQESQFIVQRTDTKMVIERLIMQEKFSREESDRLIKVLNSRVMDWSQEAGEIILLANSPGLTVDHEDVDVSSKAVLEAKEWSQEKKKVGSGSVAELSCGICNLHSAEFDHIEAEANSLVDIARSHMRDKPPWASPTENVELRTPLTMQMKLFKEGTPYLVNHDLLSSSKRQSSLASGSWNIQDELRKVRSKAIDDMLRTPHTKIDSSFFAVAPIREHSAGVMDVRVSSGPALADPHSAKINKPSGSDAAEFGRRPYINGFSSSQARVSPEDAAEMKSKQYDDENHDDGTVSENRDTNMINMEGSSEPRTGKQQGRQPGKNNRRVRSKAK